MRATIHCVISISPITPAQLHQNQMLLRSLQPATYVPRLQTKYNSPPRRFIASLVSRPQRIHPANCKPRPLHSPANISSQKITLPRPSSFSTSHIMASDDAYMDFLNKANADHSAGQEASTQGAKTQTVDESLKVPTSLQKVEAYYVSESDEPFEPVVLRFKGAAKGEWPSAGTYLP